MGGGAIFRSMARLVSTATAAAIASSSSSPSPASFAYCRIDPPPQLSAQNEGFSSLLSLSSSKEKQSDALSLPPPSSSPTSSSSSYSSFVVMEEDGGSMELCDEGGEDESLRRHIFFSPPSAEEVEEATQDLHDAIRLSLATSDGVTESSFISGAVADREDKMEEENDNRDMTLVFDKQIMRISRSSAKPSSEIGMPTERNSPVIEALQLLQTNPKVQDVVKSLASDEAVWNAMLSNEKLKEFANSQSSKHDHPDGKKDQHDKGYVNLVSFTSKVCDIVTQKVLDLFQDALVLLNSMYASFEKAFFSKGDSNALDKTVASCMMLAVAVLLMVFLKRVPK